MKETVKSGSLNPKITDVIHLKKAISPLDTDKVVDGAQSSHHLPWLPERHVQIPGFAKYISIKKNKNKKRVHAHYWFCCVYVAGRVRMIVSGCAWQLWHSHPDSSLRLGCTRFLFLFFNLFFFVQRVNAKGYMLALSELNCVNVDDDNSTLSQTAGVR